MPRRKVRRWYEGGSPAPLLAPSHQAAATAAAASATSAARVAARPRRGAERAAADSRSDRDFPGIFDVLGEGVVPISTGIKLAGRVKLPVFHPVAETMIAAAWAAQAAYAPPSFLRYLRYLCIADGAKAEHVMGFRPEYTTREALLDYINRRKASFPDSNV